MPNIRLILQYVGARYHGWQIQPDRPTVQGCLRQALGTILREEVVPQGAARTDAGVHALGQVASVRVSKPADPARLLRSLNALLPWDIRVRRVELVDDAFHARHSADGRLYRYRIVQGESFSPFEHGFAAWSRSRLDVEAMRSAARRLIGEHDFTSFRGAGDVSASPRKTIRRSEVEEAGEGLVTYSVEADSFLQYMVRNIAGTLIEVGRGRLPPERIDAILAGRARALAGPTAPPEGLYLVRVLYPHLADPEDRW